MATISDDPRIDPRIKATMGHLMTPDSADVADRDELLAIASSDTARAYRAASDEFFAVMDTEETASFEGLRSDEISFVSQPDGNEVRCRFIRPDHDEAVPAVVYLHGGGMATMSAFNGLYHSWGRLIAANGVAVVMVDFRNCVEPSTSAVAPYPAGLNDCVSGVRHVLDHAADLGVDPERVIVSGESGGGNLTLATGLRMAADGDIDRVAGLYALCPYIAGEWSTETSASVAASNGYLINITSNRGRVGYGIEAFDARDPQAWPGFATEADVASFPRTTITVNECDPLRDEGIAFYRLLLRAGVAAQCREAIGTIHGTEVFSLSCPDVSREAAAAIARFCEA